MFPFLYKTLPSSSEMFNNLIEYEPVINHKPYKLHGYLSRNRAKHLYNGKYVHYRTLEQNYKSMDALSSHFTEEVRMKARRIDKKYSPMDYWNNFKEEIIKESLKEKISVNDVIWNNAAEATNFKLSWFKFVLTVLFPNKSYEGKKLLDFSAGWGDRLLGALALKMSYVGYDPNTELHPRYQEIIETFKKDDYELTYELICQPFEEVNLEQNQFDLIFTSPPFFELEIYSEEETQSINKFKDFKTWLNCFLLTSLKKAFNSLKRGGFMVIHMSDTYYYRPVQPMLNFMRKVSNCKYMGVLGIQGLSGKTRPIWVWKKL